MPIKTTLTIDDEGFKVELVKTSGQVGIEFLDADGNVLFYLTDWQVEVMTNWLIENVPLRLSS